MKGLDARNSDHKSKVPNLSTGILENYLKLQIIGQNWLVEWPPSNKLAKDPPSNRVKVMDAGLLICKNL